MTVTEAAIIIFCVLGIGGWLLNQFKGDWRYTQGPLTTAIHDALQGKDMTHYELAKWIRRNRPGVNTGNLMLAIHSWEETGRVIKYSKFNQEKGREQIYLQWVRGGETEKTFKETQR